MRTHAAYIALSVALGYGVLAARSSSLIGAQGLPWLVLASAAVPLALSFAMSQSLTGGVFVAKLHGALARIPSARLRAWLSSRRARFQETDDCFRRFRTAPPARTRAATLLIFTQWLVESLETLVILRVLGVDIGFIEVMSFEAALSLLRSFAFFAPAGIGVQDVGYVAFLGGAGIPNAAAIAAAFVMLKRAKEIFWIAVGYAILFVTTRTRYLSATRQVLDPAE
jgi:uncharacterized membrane protein YbhN (UPF0104 family)